MRLLPVMLILVGLWEGWGWKDGEPFYFNYQPFADADKDFDCDGYDLAILAQSNWLQLHTFAPDFGKATVILRPPDGVVVEVED